MRLVGVLSAVVLLLANTLTASAANTRFFPETGQSVRDAFLDYFDAHGGVDVFGYPRTGEFVMNGHYVQYFQRARFEYWPENPPDQQVQLGNLGLELGKARPPSVASADPSRRYFQETQHSIGGAFRDFWESHDGATVFGFPITDDIQENGLQVQYFQRARFEWHGDAPADQRVQLGLLGDEQIALGKVSVPPDAAPKVAPAPVLPIAPGAAGPGKLLVSTGQDAPFYLMDPTGENAVKIGSGVDPTLSRDGTRIAYATNNQPNPGLFVANADGSNPTLVYGGQDVRGPMFSPDGSKIAFWERFQCVRVIKGRPNIPDTCTHVKVIPTGGAQPGQDWLPAGQSAYANSPTWSADGKTLFFKDEKAIYAAPLGQVAKPLSKFEPRYNTPAASPMGGQIAVAMDFNKDHYEIGLIPDDGTVSFTQLTQSPPFLYPPQTSLSPAWSPDGSKIAFVSDRDGALHVWTMNADGSNPVKISDLPITSNNSFERFVSWSVAPGQPVPTPAAQPAPQPTATPFAGPNLRPTGG